MFRSQIETKLIAEINSELDKLESLRDDPEKYAAAVDRIAKLHKLKSEEKTGLKPPSVDTVLVVGANIFGILWLARFEKTEVIKAPQAMKFVMKPR
jgi:hypothetical protein